MKVYRVVPDVNRYQSFSLEKEAQERELSALRNFEETPMTFNGTPKADNWVPPGVFIYMPKLKNGNFPGFQYTQTLVVDETALEGLRDFLEMSGELLPLPYKDKLYHVLNVVPFVNALDDNKTQWVYGKNTGEKIRIDRYAFRADRLAGTFLFKIPETNEILTCEGIKNPNEEFKGRVERLGLKGLLFEELWTDDA